MNARRLFIVSSCAAAISGSAAFADVIEIFVSIENLAPRRGTWQTPFWVGFHNGDFDTFDIGMPASNALERIAEDGNVDPLRASFAGSGFGSQDGVITHAGGPFGPGDFATMQFTIDTDDPRAHYFSFVSMVIPSNDAFIGNGNPLAHAIVDNTGEFTGADFFITGAQVLDAGTEVNTEIPEHTAFFGQMVPDTGIDENGVVHLHPGYLGSFGNPGGPQSILADPMFRGADFTLPGYPIARVTVGIVPAPGALALLGLAGVLRQRRRSK